MGIGSRCLAAVRPGLLVIGIISLLIPDLFSGSVAEPLGKVSAAAPQKSRRRSTRRRSSRRRAAAARPTLDKVAAGARDQFSTAELESGSAAINEPVLRAHLRYLADDLLEGRGTGSRGGMLAARYIAAQFEAAGLEPASSDGSYLQPVTLVGSRTDPATRMVVSSATGPTEFTFGADFVAGSDLEEAEIPVEGELLFVGYGIASPEQNWDDYKGMDVRGRLLVMLVNDPPPTTAEPNLFGGNALTYYGRWTYKFEEAARRGAAGAILIHTRPSAGYDWSVVRNSWSGERFAVISDTASETRSASGSGAPSALRMKGWVTAEAAGRLLRSTGLGLEELQQAAAHRDFRPVTIPARLAINLRSQVRRVTSPNVVAIHRGSDPALRKQFVVYSSHWDHLGVRPDQPGDNIYNGAVDNATGIAGMIALARACATGRIRPRRSILFVATTAEEQGLLGAEYYLRHPLVPIADTVANLNLDSLNILGLTTDFIPLGADRSTLARIVEDAAQANRLTISPEANPEQGAFYRSDHFPFAKAGIPAMSLLTGRRFVGHSESWVAEQQAEYGQRYHQPGDEYNPHWDLSGLVQQVRLAYEIGLRIANADAAPQWNPGDEFAAARGEGPRQDD